MEQPGVYQATGFKLYSPSEDILPQAWVCMYLTEDCDVDVTDKEGHDEDNVPFKAGYHPILVQKIRAVSTGLVYILTYDRLR